MLVWGLLVVKLCVKVCLFVLSCRGPRSFICFILLLCSVGGVVPILFFFVVVDPCCCKIGNMNGCFVFVVVVLITAKKLYFDSRKSSKIVFKNNYLAIICA